MSDDVGARLDALVDGVERYRRGIGALGATDHLGPDAGCPGLQLVGGGRAEGVGGAENHPAAIGDQHPGQLADRGRLAGAVDPDDQHHRRVIGVRQRPHGAIQLRVQLGDQHLTQHRAGIGFCADPAAGEPLTQRGRPPNR